MARRSKETVTVFLEKDEYEKIKSFLKKDKDSSYEEDNSFSWNVKNYFFHKVGLERPMTPQENARRIAREFQKNKRQIKKS